MDAVSSCERERCDDYRSQYSDFSNQMPVLYEAEMACFQWAPRIFEVRADFFSAGKPSACALAFRRRKRTHSFGAQRVHQQQQARNDNILIPYHDLTK